MSLNLKICLALIDLKFTVPSIPAFLDWNKAPSTFYFYPRPAWVSLECWCCLIHSFTAWWLEAPFDIHLDPSAALSVPSAPPVARSVAWYRWLLVETRCVRAISCHWLPPQVPTFVIFGQRPTWRQSNYPTMACTARSPHHRWQCPQESCYRLKRLFVAR